MMDAVLDELFFVKLFVSMGDDLIDETASVLFFLLYLGDGSVFTFVDAVQLLFFYFA
jgi:hypothetical protein